MDFWTALGTIAALIAAAAACFAAVFTYLIMRSAHEQVKVSQEQNQRTLESERDAQLPVLIPTAVIKSAGNTDSGLVNGYDRTQPFVRIAIQNIGPGIALNVWGVVFEPEPELDVDNVTRQRHFHRYDLPISPSMEIVKDWKPVDLPFAGDATLDLGGPYKLYAPPTPALGNLFMGATDYNARLTLTYSDIFGRKHAAIYDFTAQKEWVNVAYLRNIPHDLDGLTRESLSSVPVLSSSSLPATSSE